MFLAHTRPCPVFKNNQSARLACLLSVQAKIKAAFILGAGTEHISQTFENVFKRYLHKVLRCFMQKNWPENVTIYGLQEKSVSECTTRNFPVWPSFYRYPVDVVVFFIKATSGREARKTIIWGRAFSGFFLNLAASPVIMPENTG